MPATSAHLHFARRQRLYHLIKQGKSPNIILAEQQGRVTTNYPSTTSTSTTAAILTTPTPPTTPLARGENSTGIGTDAVIQNEGDSNIRDVPAALGVSHVGACRLARSDIRAPPTTFMEANGQGRQVRASREQRRTLNCKGLRALDLRCLKPGGTPWDFSKEADRALAEHLVEEDKPDWLSGSPP